MSAGIENYILEEKLGHGTSGQVFKGKVRDVPTQAVAVKFIPKKSLSSSGKDNLINEIRALKKLQHKFIIQMLDFSWTDTHVYIAMEFANSGDLSSFIKKRKALPESLGRIFCQQLCSALLFMRKHNISHMDLKPSNLLLHRPSPELNPILKIADFGFAHKLDGENDLGVRGSPLYMAPEIVLTKTYSPKVDIWSVGVILFEALFGRAPFSSQTIEQLINKIKEDTPVVIPRDRKLTDNCRRFLAACLQRNPELRLNFKGMEDDPFLDLEFSVPHEHTQDRMTVEEEKGAVAESQQSNEEAVGHYERALSYAKTLYYYAEESSSRRKWKSVLQGYQRKLSALKPGGGGASPDQSTVTNMGADYKELNDLCKVTPGLRDGLEICSAARNYQLEGDLRQAIDRYTAGLGVLMPLLQTEPKGVRRDMLHEAVMGWLQQAETCKSSLLANQSNMQKMEADTEKQCVLQ